ncbi:MAG: DUF4293 family protein [Bacteroidetes bacterium]|nr:DUF4293 family protein [Bacteroidota bacterium]
MIQRKQTLYFLISLICLFLILALPSITYKIDDIWFNFSFLNNAFEANEHLTFYAKALFYGISITLLLQIISIFIYKKRTTQIKLAYTVIALSLLSFLIICFFSVVKNIQEVKIQVYIFALYLIILVAQLLAIKGIKADINLLKSADRIR